MCPDDGLINRNRQAIRLFLFICKNIIPEDCIPTCIRSNTYYEYNNFVLCCVPFAVITTLHRNCIGLTNFTKRSNGILSIPSVKLPTTDSYLCFTSNKSFKQMARPLNRQILAFIHILCYMF